MMIPQALNNYSLTQGKANFLTGISGNGITTLLQNEIYKNPTPNLLYITFAEFESTREKDILLEIIQKILTKFSNTRLSAKDIKSSNNNLELFQKLIDILKSEDKQEWVIIFDQIECVFNFSSAFFFALHKVFTLNQIVNNINLTSILIADQYLNPYEGKYPKGLESFIFTNTNINTIKSFSKKDITYLVLKGSKESPSVIKKIHVLGFGNPAICESIYNFYKSTNNFDIPSLLNTYDLEWKLNEIWDVIEDNNRNLLIEIVEGKTPYFLNDLQKQFLTSIEFIEDNKIKSQLLKSFIKNQISKINKKQTEYITFNNSSIYLPNLTSQLTKLLFLLVDNKNKLVTRDQIAEKIWGNTYNTNYSNYAIDKHISNLRKQLTKLNDDKLILTTVKGKGYILNF